MNDPLYATNSARNANRPSLLPILDDIMASRSAEQWLANLTTPGKRVGAFLMGIAGLIILVGAAPATLVAAVVLLAAAALLANRDSATSPETAPAESATNVEHKE